MAVTKNSKKIMFVIVALLLLAIVISKSGFIENLAGQQEQTAGAGPLGFQLTPFFAWQALVVLITLTAIIAITLQFTQNNNKKVQKTKKR